MMGNEVAYERYDKNKYIDKFYYYKDQKT